MLVGPQLVMQPQPLTLSLHTGSPLPFGQVRAWAPSCLNGSKEIENPSLVMVRLYAPATHLFCANAKQCMDVNNASQINYSGNEEEHNHVVARCSKSRRL
jgi:hypothetical protein